MNRLKTVIYIDVLLLVNFLIAVFLLLAVGVLCGYSKPLWRLCCGGVLASLATLILFAPALPFWAQLCYQALSAALVVASSYGMQHKRQFFMLLAWYYLLNLLFSGVITAYLVQSKNTYHGMQANNLSVYLYISPTILIACVIGVYLALKCIVFCFAAPYKNTPPQEIKLMLQGNMLTLRAFYDTGFSLQDPFSNRQVLLLSLPSVQAQLSPAILAQLAAAEGQNAAQDILQEPLQGSIPIRFLPCGTIAGQCLLPAICAEYIYLAQHPQHRTENILVAFSKEASFCNGCNALFGADLAAQLIEKEFCHA